jgi:hypothetical protein
MPSPPSCDPPLFGLDPLYWCHAKVFARTLQQLPPFSNFPGSVQLFGHPLRSVQLMGCVVRLHANHQRTLFLRALCPPHPTRYHHAAATAHPCFLAQVR